MVVCPVVVCKEKIMKELMKSVAVLSIVAVGAYLSDHNFTNFIGTALILVGGLWGGYLDGFKAGKREILTGGK